MAARPTLGSGPARMPSPHFVPPGGSSVSSQNPHTHSLPRPPAPCERGSFLLPHGSAPTGGSSFPAPPPHQPRVQGRPCIQCPSSMGARPEQVLPPPNLLPRHRKASIISGSPEKDPTASGPSSGRVGGQGPNLPETESCSQESPCPQSGLSWGPGHLCPAKAIWGFRGAEGYCSPPGSSCQAWLSPQTVFFLSHFQDPPFAETLTTVIGRLSPAPCMAAANGPPPTQLPGPQGSYRGWCTEQMAMALGQ